MSKRVYRILQKPPYAYMAATFLLMVYIVICTISGGIFFSIIGLVFLLGGWGMIERGATHNKRLEAMRRRLHELDNKED